MDPLLSHKGSMNTISLLLSLSGERYPFHMPRDSHAKEWTGIKTVVSDFSRWPVDIYRQGGQAGLAGRLAEYLQNS